jgi:hypothetical protein
MTEDPYLPDPLNITDESYAKGKMVTCYPNPTQGMVHLQGMTEGSCAMINISGIDGKLIMNRELQVYDRKVENMIDLCNCRKGLYFIIVQTTERSYTFKIVLQPN